MTLILDGRKLADLHAQPMRERAAALEQTLGRKPCLQVVLVGDNPASLKYINAKEKASEKIGIEARVTRLPEQSNIDDVARVLTALSEDAKVDGIILQLPLPKHLQHETEKLLRLISPEKDADGLHPLNQGALLIPNSKALTACTPRAVMELLKVAELGHFPEHIEELKDLDFSGRRAVVLGRSNLVGRPVAELLTSANATVAVAHSKSLPGTPRELCLSSEIIVSATGSPRLVKGDWIPENATVIDVGMNRSPEGTLCGDVDYPAAEPRAKAITPVPGGVGPMTVCMLLDNVLKCAESKS